MMESQDNDGSVNVLTADYIPGNDSFDASTLTLSQKFSDAQIINYRNIGAKDLNKLTA